MLNQLLELLKTGGTRRVGDMAHELNTTPELVEIMLEDLTRMGYLKQVGDTCSGTCAGCEMTGLCAAGAQGQLWALTEKGESA